MRLPLFLLLALLGCDVGDPCEGVRDLATSPAGIELVEAEHPGWGRDDCAQCHPDWKVHAHDCIETADLDLSALRDRADLADPSSCVPCHGTNGVSAWDTGP